MAKEPQVRCKHCWEPFDSPKDHDFCQDINMVTTDADFMLIPLTTKRDGKLIDDLSGMPD